MELYKDNNLETDSFSVGSTKKLCSDNLILIMVVIKLTSKFKDKL